MAAPGLFTSVKVEVQFTPGVWSDVSGDVALEEGVQISQGRQGEQDDVSPGQATFTLRNDTGKYTPNNPTSAFWPYVTEGRPVRISVVKSAVTYRRFTGTITQLAPEFPDDNSSTGTVQITAMDPLAALGNRRLLAPHVEEQVRGARLANDWCDVYTLHKRARTSSRAPTFFTNYGYLEDGATQSVGTMKILYTGHGSSQLSTPDGLLTDFAIDLLPRPKYSSGPVLKIMPGTASRGVPSFPERFEFWFKVPSSYTLSSGTGIICDVWQTIGLVAGVFSIRVRPVGGVLRLSQYDTGGVFDQDINDEDGNAATFINDDSWHKLTIASDSAPGPTAVYLDDLYSTKITLFQDLEGCDTFYLGGGVFPSRETKSVSCPVVSFAAISLAGITNGGPLHNYAGVPTAFVTGSPSITDAQTRYYELLGYGNKSITQRFATNVTYTATSTTVTSTDPVFTSNDVGAGIGINVTAIPPNAKIATFVSPKQITMSVPATASGSTNLLIGPAMIGSDIRSVARIPTTDSDNIQQALQDLARTWGGYAWADVFGNINIINPDAINPVTPLASLDVESDIEASALQLERTSDVPTRVTVSGPIGDLIYVDFAREAGTTTGTPFRQEFSVNAGAWTEGEAYALGGFYATRSRGLRITKIDLDLVTAQTDLYSTMLTSGSLYPGVRLRGAGLPTAVFGVSQSDVVVQGWTESYTPLAAVFSFDLTPADDPVQGVWDDAEFGRWAAGTTALDLGYALTSGATTLVVAPGDNSGVTVTTSAGDYPLDLDILGERVTSAGVPGTLSRTNLVTNPSFEVNTTGWAGTAAATIARTTVLTSEIDGSVSGLVTWPTVSALGSTVGYAFAVTSGTTYTFSIYVYVPSGSPRVQVGELSNLGSSVTYSRQDTTSYNDAWVRLGVTLTAAATTTYTFVVRNLDAATSGQVCFLDAVLLEATTRGQGSYFDGSNGGAWTGTADASTSTQTAQTFTVTRGVSPTVARAHEASETVDIYHAMTWAI